MRRVAAELELVLVFLHTLCRWGSKLPVWGVIVLAAGVCTHRLRLLLQSGAESLCLSCHAPALLACACTCLATVQMHRFPPQLLSASLCGVFSVFACPLAKPRLHAPLTLRQCRSQNHEPTFCVSAPDSLCWRLWCDRIGLSGHAGE